jgi:hypothetical protein
VSSGLGVGTREKERFMVAITCETTWVGLHVRMSGWEVSQAARRRMMMSIDDDVVDDTESDDGRLHAPPSSVLGSGNKNHGGHRPFPLKRGPSSTSTSPCSQVDVRIITIDSIMHRMDAHRGSDRWFGSFF